MAFLYAFSLALLLGCLINLFTYYSSEYYSQTHIGFFKMWRDKGRYGEWMIYTKLKTLRKQGTLFLFNLYLPIQNKETIEVDMVVITHQGLFVIESKNYSGHITGKYGDEDWTQEFKNTEGKVVYSTRFYNPIKQNQVHTNCLRTGLSLKCPAWSFVVFGDRADIDKVRYSMPYLCVTTTAEVCDEVKRAAKGRAKRLSGKEVTALYKALYPYTQPSAKTKKKHIQYVKTRKEKKNVQKSKSR